MDYQNILKEWVKDHQIMDSLEITGSELSQQLSRTGETMINLVVYNLPVTLINNIEESRIRLLAGSLIVDIKDFNTTIQDNLPVDHMSRWDLRSLAVLLAVLYNVKEKHGKLEES